MQNKPLLFLSAILLFVGISSQSPLFAQKTLPKDSLMKAASDIISQNHYCSLVTVDSVGQPQIRTMNPFPNPKEFVVWFATSRYSSKAREIRSNPKVAVYYADHAKGNGYVTITGTATVIDDKDLLMKMKRDYWNGISGWQDIFVLIKVVPQKLEVINYTYGAVNDPKTFRAPAVVF